MVGVAFCAISGVTGGRGGGGWGGGQSDPPETFHQEIFGD